eukprot:11180984-Lingulodinium_polyedra.AAC.1
MLQRVVAIGFRADCGDFCGRDEGYQESFRADAKANGGRRGHRRLGDGWGRDPRRSKVVRSADDQDHRTM